MRALPVLAWDGTETARTTDMSDTTKALTTKRQKTGCYQSQDYRTELQITSFQGPQGSPRELPTLHPGSHLHLAHNLAREGNLQRRRLAVLSNMKDEQIPRIPTIPRAVVLGPARALMEHRLAGHTPRGAERNLAAVVLQLSCQHRPPNHKRTTRNNSPNPWDTKTRQTPCTPTRAPA